MRACFVIPARSGSKGLPGKNLLPVAGVSLVGHAARVARRAVHRLGLDGSVIIDTDSPEIGDEARRWGATLPFLRPSTLARDDTPTVASVRHLLSRLGTFDVVVLLQPTSPLRSVEDVVACVAAASATGSSAAVVGASHAAFAMERGHDSALRWVRSPASLRRQDQSALWAPCGSVYVTTPRLLDDHGSFLIDGRTIGVEVPRARSLDVDDGADLAIADALARSRTPAPIDVGSRRVGGDAPCFVIAEAGVNHDGDVARAHALIDIAADAGADAVKFQTFDPARLAARAAPMAEYQQANTGRSESQLAMLTRLTLPHEAHESLMRHARDRGLMFLSTAFDESSADLLEALDVPAFKVPSGEMTNIPFLAHLARKGRPMLLSTGMCEMHEIGAALDAVDATRPGLPVAIFQCVTSYPAQPADTNLRAMATMRAAFEAPVGLSDHTEGISTAIAAAGAGACMIEKHFTTDRSLPGPDHRVSLEPRELSTLIQAVRDADAARGDGVKMPRPNEVVLRSAARRSVHTARDLPMGHVIHESDLVALRPGDGIAPSQIARLVGRRTRAALATGTMLRMGDLDD